MNEGMGLSASGVAFIARHEGFRAHVYRDAAGNPTIGYGHLLREGEGFRDGIFEGAARELLRRDASGAESAIRNDVATALNQHQFDALVSFTFNVGAGAFLRSTLLAKLNDGEFAAAADQFPRWNKVRIEGVLTTNPGLTRRREDERRLFRDGDYGF
ncbi:MAG: lysozyme [Stellaceae bacterium]